MYYVEHVISNCEWTLNINYEKYDLNEFLIENKWDVGIDMVKRTILIHEMNLQCNYGNMNI